MKIRFLGHSCVEIVGKHHILIDPDFTRDPLPNVEYICVLIAFYAKKLVNNVRLI